jgi:RHS repeat-associated protein
MVSRQVIYFRQAALLIAEGIGIWSPQSYRFCGKELDSTSALNLYWFGSRLYDPLTARWTTQDPMSEKYYASSPYAYCQNDPVKYIDRKPPVKCVLRFCPISIRVGAISSEFVPMAWE